jgi:hypothetical protein
MCVENRWRAIRIQIGFEAADSFLLMVRNKKKAFNLPQME